MLQSNLLQYGFKLKVKPQKQLPSKPANEKVFKYKREKKKKIKCTMIIRDKKNKKKSTMIITDKKNKKKIKIKQQKTNKQIQRCFCTKYVHYYLYITLYINIK